MHYGGSWKGWQEERRVYGSILFMAEGISSGNLKRDFAVVQAFVRRGNVPPQMQALPAPKVRPQFLILQYPGLIGLQSRQQPTSGCR